MHCHVTIQWRWGKIVCDVADMTSKAIHFKSITTLSTLLRFQLYLCDKAKVTTALGLTGVLIIQLKPLETPATYL